MPSLIFPQFTKYKHFSLSRNVLSGILPSYLNFVVDRTTTAVTLVTWHARVGRGYHDRVPGLLAPLRLGMHDMG